MLPTSILLLLLLLTTSQSTQLPNNYGGKFCLRNNGNYSENSTFQRNLDSALSLLQTTSSSSSFSSTTSDEIYSRYFCRHDLSLPDCSSCIHSAAKRILLDCPSSKEAVVWFEQCTLLYVNSSSRLDDFDLEIPNVRLFEPPKVIDVDAFYPVLVADLNRVISESAYGNGSYGFATAEANVSLFETLYSLGQCSGDVTGLLCERCLRNALFHVDLCCKDYADMAYFYPNCQLRYSVLGPFYVVGKSKTGPPGVSQPEPAPQGNGATTLSCWNILQFGAIVATTTLMLILRN